MQILEQVVDGLDAHREPHQVARHLQQIRAASHAAVPDPRTAPADTTSAAAAPREEIR